MTISDYLLSLADAYHLSDVSFRALCEQVESFLDVTSTRTSGVAFEATPRERPPLDGVFDEATIEVDASTLIDAAPALLEGSTRVALGSQTQPDGGVTLPGPNEETVSRAVKQSGALPIVASAAALDLGERYEDLGRLGVGGMGEVRRVHDRVLGRRLAMKIVKHEISAQGRSLSRFVEEAQVGAQLQHPGLVPIYDLGQLPDRRLFFTMREIKGRSFEAALRALEAGEGAEEWTLRRRIATLLRVCEAVGYAHSHGVVHRDLKPENIMLGDSGEVLVVDWGIAKILGRDEPEAVETHRSRDQTYATQHGMITGTPAYMPPEQALGQLEKIDARSDVYALGAILYRVLCGRLPYHDRHGLSVLLAVVESPPPPVAEVSLERLPEALVEVCERAMRHDVDARFEDARAMADALSRWVEGARARTRGLDEVEASRGLDAKARVHHAEAKRHQAAAEAHLKGVPSHAPEVEKHAGWLAEEAARQAHRAAVLAELEAEARLEVALSHAPDLGEARVALADRHARAHAEAEAKKDTEGALRAEARLRTQLEALPRSHPNRRRHEAYLEGLGALTLTSDPPDAEVLVYRYEERLRRLHAVFDRSLGRTPCVDAPLPHGSYLVVLRREGHEETRYPIHVERQGRWSTTRPGSPQASPVWLPPEGALSSGDVYVPAGWFLSGGDPDALAGGPRRRLWVDGFAIKRFPVTNAEFIGFLDDLVAQGREDEALRHAPHERGGAMGERGAMIYGFDRGRFVLRPDADGDVWLPDFPVVLIDWSGARAYCEWLAVKTGRPWRLPSEWEREKATRGVDGRAYPWGDGFDATWCCMRDSHPGRPTPSVVDRYPVDCSPYGVRGVAGNTRDWCADAWRESGPEDALVVRSDPDDDAPRRTLRGGSWSSHEHPCRAANRFHDAPTYSYYSYGVRPVYSAP